MKNIPQILFFLFAMTATAHAQERITADRPDATEAATLTPRHFFQAEFGFGAENMGLHNYNIIHPTVLLKYGLAKRFELRLENNLVSSYSLVIPAGTIKRTGFEPMRIGFRTALWEEKKWIPKTSLLVHFGIPGIASSNFKAQHVAPSFLLAMENTITDKIGIGYNFGVEWDGFSNDPVWIYSVSAGFSLGKRWETFLEIFAFGQEEIFENYLDTGLGFYLNNNMKLDAYVGVGVNDAVLNNFFGVGFSFRVH
jgi:hypothetical protein